MKNRTKKFVLSLSLLLISLLVFVGCGGAEKAPTGDSIKNALDGAPDWVIKNCDVYWDDEEDKQLCGVGSAGGSRNISLMRTTATGRGRTEIARSLETKVKSMLKDYQATTTGGEDFGNAANDEQHIVDVTKQITDTTLSGTEMVDSWIADDGTFYALVALNVNKFKDAVSQMGQLSESIRAAVVERAEKEFADLDKEIEKERESNQ